MQLQYTVAPSRIELELYVTAQLAQVSLLASAAAYVVVAGSKVARVVVAIAVVVEGRSRKEL